MHLHWWQVTQTTSILPSRISTTRPILQGLLSTIYRVIFESPTETACWESGKEKTFSEIETGRELCMLSASRFDDPPIY